MTNATARRSAERGFTLIELMIVVAIIAILAAVLIPNFVNARAQAQTSACESNLRSIATALELYYADQQSYPNGAVPAALQGPNNVNYLNNTPRDPADPANAPYQITNPAGDAQQYLVTCPGQHVGATMSKLTNQTGGGLCGANCGNGSMGYKSGIGLVKI